MTLLQMRYILEVERCGSMNRAAQDLFISQSALSTAILEVEKELGISYPTVRSKLDAVIKKLGYELGTGAQTAKKEEILKALESGEITVEQAIAQLK